MLGKAEVIVHNTVYHSRPEGQLGIVHHYGRHLDSRDPPFIVPTLVLTEEWQQLPYGHVRSVGMIVVRNDEGAFPVTIPTDQERDEMSRRVVELALFGPTFAGPVPVVEVHPGCSQAITPVESDPARLQIRCRHGKASCWLMVVPR